MTQTPTVITQHTQTGPSPSRAYPVAPVTGLNPSAANPSVAIPYPGTAAAGAGSVLPRQTVPVVMTHCILANSSPYTIIVTQGGNLTQIPAFTADDVIVLEGGQGAPIMVTPLATGATVASGVDTSIYATWYDGDPPGVYPAVIGSGSTPLTQQTNILTLPINVATGTINQAVMVPPSAQAISVRIDWSGPPVNPGFLMTVTDTGAGTTLLQGITFAPAQVLYVPVNGRNVTLNVSTLVGGVTGGTMTGTMYVNALPYSTVTVPTLGSLNTLAGTAPQQGTQMGLVGEATIASTGQVMIVPRAATGFVVRLHVITYRMAVAPAAGAQQHLRGAASAFNYCTWESPGALPCSQSFPMNGTIVGANATAGNLDGNEQLNLVNNTAQSLTAAVTYDVIPTPYA